MTVYVDSLRPCIPNARWRFGESCHLFADADDELHAFAARLGLRREWFQADKRLHHYDLTRGKRTQALSLGAQDGDEELRRRLRALHGQPALAIEANALKPARDLARRTLFDVGAAGGKPGHAR